MANVTKLNNTGSIYFLEVDADPSLAATTLPNGDSVPVGSIAFANLAGVGKGWIKTTISDTGYNEIDQNNADWSLAGNALTGATALTPNENIGSTNAYDVKLIRNNAERIRLAAEGAIFHSANYADYTNLPAAYRSSLMTLQATNGSYVQSQLFNNGGAGGYPLRNSFGATGSLTTTAATGTLALSNIATQTDSEMVVMATISGRQTAGSAGTVGNVFSYLIQAIVRNVGGVVTIRQQASLSQYEDDTAGTYNAVFSTTGTNVFITITQPLNRVVKWFGFFDIIQVTN